MKKTIQSGQLQNLTTTTRRRKLRSRLYQINRRLQRLIPGTTVVLVLCTLVLYLLAGQNTGLLSGQPVGQTRLAGLANEDDVLFYAEADDDYQDSLLNRSLNFASILAASDTALPDEPIGLEMAATEPAQITESALVPEPTQISAPPQVPRIYDAGGIPQEGLAIDQFTADNTVYYVKVNVANIRELPNTAAAVAARVTLGDQLTRLGYGLDWSQVKLADGQTGYVLSSLITAGVVAKPTPSPTPKPTPKLTPKPTAAPVPTAGTASGSLTAAQQQAIVDLAKSCLGVKYVYGSESPATGFDCSGLTTYIYKKLFNITLPRSALSQAKAGTAVSRSNIAIGDIICFDWDNSDGKCDHVGIYIGGGEYIHATHSRGLVVQSALKSTNPVVSIRRIIR